MLRPSFLGALLITLFVSKTLSASTFVIPFRMVNQLILFQGKINGVTGNFILDTGTSDMLLNRAYFPDIGRTDLRSSNQSFTGHHSDQDGAYLQLLLKGGLRLRSFALVVDLHHLEEQKRMKIHGLVGINTFRDYEVLVDNLAEEIILRKLNRKGEPQTPIPAYQGAFQIPLRFKGHLPCFEIRQGGKSYTVALDTGSEVNVFAPSLEHDLARAGILPSFVNTMDVEGNTQLGRRLVVSDWRVGPWTLPALEIVFLPIHALQKLSGPRLDGLVGYEFLQHFTVGFNLRRRAVYLLDRQGARQKWLVKSGNVQARNRSILQPGGEMTGKQDQEE